MDEFWKGQVQALKEQLKAAEALRKAAEEAYRAAYSFLEELARIVVPEAYDSYLKERLGVPPADVQEFGRWLCEAARSRIAYLELMGGGKAAQQVEELLKERDALREELNRLRGVEDALREAEARVQELEDRLRAKEAEVAALRRREIERTSAAVPAPQAPASSAAPELSELQLAAVRLLGFTGKALLSDVMNALDEEGLVTAGSGASYRLFKELEQLGVIERIAPATESLGRAPHLVRLTEKGREIFQKAFGQAPAPSEYDELKKRHVSDEHTLLNLQAKEVLERAGYVVDLFPDPIRTDEGDFYPDLVAVKDGKVIYVECERGGPKDRRQRRAKWRAVHRHNGGHFYVVVPNVKTRNQIATELDKFALAERVEGFMHICVLSKLESGSPWSYERRLAVKG